jgi:hypothetical protein
MRMSRFSFLALAGALALAPRHAQAQVSATIHLGTPLTVTAYSASAHGEWSANYKKWTPKTVYAYNGQYYSHTVKGGRAVQIYHHGNDNFLPPQDAKWQGADKRYNYNRKPTDDDYTHVSPHQ